MKAILMLFFFILMEITQMLMKKVAGKKTTNSKSYSIGLRTCTGTRAGAVGNIRNALLARAHPQPILSWPTSTHPVGGSGNSGLSS